MYYAVSDATANKLRDLIGDKGGTPGGVSTGSAHRQVSYVKCVSWSTSAHTGTGQVAQRDSSGWTYFGTAGEMLLLEANGGDLTVGSRYPAVRMGTSGTADIFVAFAGAATGVEIGCGMEYDEDGKLQFDAEAVAGLGLKASETGCVIDVNPGCAITIGDGKVNVRVEDLPDEARGIEAVGSGTCKKLGIRQGCGITVDGDGGVTVFSPDVVGLGLQPGATPCQIDVKTGCGVTIDGSGGLTVFSPAIAGPGLQPGATPCLVEVKAGCGVIVDTTGVRVNNVALAGPGLVPYSPCGLAVNPGCGIKVENDQVAFKAPDVAGLGLKADASGCVIDVNPGCAISVGDGKVNVRVEDLPDADGGLKAVGAGTCKRLAVKAACGIFVDEDGVAVKNADLAGDCLIPDPTTCQLHVDTDVDTEFTYSTVTAQTLSASGCSVSLQTTTQTVTVKKNACGLVVDVVLGMPITTTQTASVNPMTCIDISAICNQCKGSSSSSVSMASSSSSRSNTSSSSSSRSNTSSSSSSAVAASSSSSSGLGGPSLSSASVKASSAVVMDMVMGMAAGEDAAVGTTWTPDGQDDAIVDDYGTPVLRPTPKRKPCNCRGTQAG